MPIRNLKQEWVFPKLEQVPGMYQAAIGGSSLVARTLYRRGQVDLQKALAFLDPDRYQPSPASELPGLIAGADRLQAAISESSRILIWGDFDVDGQTSTTLLFAALSELGANADYHIPIRATESHGISVPVLKELIARQQPQLLLTCDTGIDEVDAINYARQQGLDVIITDHHQLPPALPDASSIINPNQLPAGHPLFNLPGVGVAYKLIEELFQRYRKDPAPYLDLVALGIVSDVATQTADTRYLLQRGLDVLRQTPRSGIRQLCALAGISPADIDEEQIGFLIGPRLNALGRLDNANPSVEFLTTTDSARAQKMALFLDELNRRRQDLTESIFQESLQKIESDPGLVDENPVLVLAGPPTWEPGVIGIVASRLVERFHKPTIILSQDGGNFRGSARSIPGVPISRLISENASLLISFGGHPMAAGLSLPVENLSPFRTSLANTFYRVVGSLPESISIEIDSELTLQDISLDLISDIKRLAPFGPGNPKLLFATRSAAIRSQQIIGKNRTHRKLVLTDPSGASADILWWNSADKDIPDQPLDIAYTLDSTTYKNEPQVQATLHHIRHSPDAPVHIQTAPDLSFIDHRTHPDPHQELQRMLSKEDAVVWAERVYPGDILSCRRSDLKPGSRLVIWTAPPSQLVLTQAVESVQPLEIILFGNNPSFASLDEFIQAVLGLIKHLSASNKPFSLERFAQALAVPKDTLEVAMTWISLKGIVDFNDFSEQDPALGLPASQQADFIQVDSKLKQMLKEIAAYRRYYLSARPNNLL